MANEQNKERITRRAFFELLTGGVLCGFGGGYMATSPFIDTSPEATKKRTLQKFNNKMAQAEESWTASMKASDASGTLPEGYNATQEGHKYLKSISKDVMREAKIDAITEQDGYKMLGGVVGSIMGGVTGAYIGRETDKKANRNVGDARLGIGQAKTGLDHKSDHAFEYEFDCSTTGEAISRVDIDRD